ncbi:MAG: T9SS type A sorting domain-containing protein [Luteibaculaceae bacterium]
MLFKRLCFSSFCILFGFFASAQYVSPGTGQHISLFELFVNSNGAVSLNEQGAYVFNQDITISAQDTLSILEDATILGAAGKRLTIEGHLKIAPPELVNFSSLNSSTDNVFTGLYFMPGSSASVDKLTLSFVATVQINTIEQVHFTNAVFSNFTGAPPAGQTSINRGMIRLLSGKPIFENCFFGNTNFSAIFMNISVDTGAPKLVGNTFSNFNGSTRNVLQLANSGADTIWVENNTFTRANEPGNGGPWFGCNNNHPLNLVFRGNTVESHNFGLAIAGGFPTSGLVNALVENNSFLNNNTVANPMAGGSGIVVFGAASHDSLRVYAKVRNNNFEGNLWGISVSNATVDAGTLTDFGNNSFLNNGHNELTVNLANNSGFVTSAIGNCWIPDENYSLAQALETIQDHTFNANFSPVLIEPFITCGDATVGITTLNSSKNESLKIWPNPATSTLFFSTAEPPMQLTLYSVSGKILLQTNHFTHADTHQIEVDYLAPGVYFLEILDRDSRKTVKKWIKN